LEQRYPSSFDLNLSGFSHREVGLLQALQVSHRKEGLEGRRIWQSQREKIKQPVYEKMAALHQTMYKKCLN